MLSALSGFGVIWVVIGVGWLLAQLNVITMEGQRFLNKLAFVVASPALLFTIVATGSLDHLFSRTLGASVVAIIVSALLYLLLDRLFFHHDLGGSTIGWMASAYTNAGNLGLPIAAHVLGDMTWMAPIMLIQVGILQPFALACLDISNARAEGRKLTPWRYVTLPFRNPITVGILLGLVFNLAHWHLPDWLQQSVTMVGNMAVPMMLLAFGVSLRRDPLPGTGPQAAEVWSVQVIKIILMPLIAIGVGMVMGLPRHDLLGVGVLAALPCAQNVYVIAQRYNQSVSVARDCVFWSTILSVPAIVALAAVFA